jgi:hypothetical protein
MVGVRERETREGEGRVEGVLNLLMLINLKSWIKVLFV